ncbi:MurG1 [Desulforapulum autotrophicum HRM2]|uniref:UDP-N-acetylglucosamine--N-acetylmuramyl-(pentapeptide) pyrophosphoryl-undecaprenol N-acetylglucosamine transferase n=1 Tax=Desulforapulum autotrophicum (strain ATCC 43914 / DSM 3382 / VKM B-1955 / HRM2) TaxID=177437 RepID=C0Q8P3_DESAH|nr:undecaprenyldiphospho-muramoylpentapeptide beta-N-acetylglucosaminyltransferase [Desulforapulum autotrophicum]ACN14383.1 MurG1 [Desulforapulum autotrophicum HRM2]
MDKPLKIIIAGGKTGGHLFPGIAIAQAFSAAVPGTRILFVGTGETFETTTLDRYGFDHTAISISGIKGKGLMGKLSTALRLPVSLVQTFTIIRGFKPDIVMGVGGYSSGPVVLVARLLNILTAIQEQNTIPGITNRILSRICHVVFTSFKSTRGLSKNAVIHHTGNPVRKSDIQSSGSVQSDFGQGSGCFNLLVTGGSQGAHSINQAMVGAMTLLKDPAAVFLVHQTGKADAAEVADAYHTLGVNGVARAFFDDLPQRMAGADLIVSRAGAGAISEITHLGKPSILVPYPHAADDHQRFNAQAVKDQGGAVLILDRDLTPERLKTIIEDLHNNPEHRLSMGRAAKGMALSDPARAIVDICLSMAGKKGK